MRHPVSGLLWHSWRLSRRWYLLILAIALAIHFSIMNMAPPGMAALPNVREYLAPGTIVVGLLLALFTTLLAISLGGRAGFPMRFEYRLPVSTPLLVGVPMLALGAMCASLYAIPLLISRIIYGLQMPVVAGAVMVGTVATLLAAASWAAATSAIRGVNLAVAVAFGARLLTWMQPFHFKDGTKRGERVFDPDMISFSGTQYVLLTLLILALYGLTVHSVGIQRQGERWRAAFTRPGISVRGGASGSLLDRASDLLKIPSLVSSPWAAELWLECKRYAVPILLLALLFALLMPVLPLADSRLGSRNGRLLVTAAPVLLFLTGVGLGIFNRRIAGGGYMNPFEGTRGLGTLQLAGIQLGALGTALILGTGLIGLSLWLSAPMYEDFGPLWSRLAGLFETAQGGTIVQQAGTVTSVVVGYFTLMAFLFCVHSCSTFWGRKIMYGTLIFLFYAVFFAHEALTDQNAGEFVAQNMWWLAAATLVLTLLVVARVAALRLFTLKSGTITLLAWLLGLTGAALMLQRLDVHLLTLPPELKALNAALLTLPLTLFLCTVWCYDRLRHH